MEPVDVLPIQRNLFCGSSAFRTQRAILLFCVIILSSLAFVFHSEVVTTVKALLSWVECHPFTGFFAFVSLYILFVLLALPASILSLAAGFTFSSALGTFYGLIVAILAVVLGAFLGALFAFWIGRQLFRPVITPWLRDYPLITSLDSAFVEHGVRTHVLLRLSPLVPFSTLNYLLSVTSISFTNYIAGLSALVPGAGLYVLLGAAPLLGNKFEAETSWVKIIFLGGGIFSFIVALVSITLHAKRRLEETLQRTPLSVPMNEVEGGYQPLDQQTA